MTNEQKPEDERHIEPSATYAWASLETDEASPARIYPMENSSADFLRQNDGQEIEVCSRGTMARIAVLQSRALAAEAKLSVRDAMYDGQRIEFDAALASRNAQIAELEDQRNMLGAINGQLRIDNRWAAEHAHKDQLRATELEAKNTSLQYEVDSLRGEQ